ncbi:MAG: hypothetical protein RIM23_28900 [Coleofasciculus sp. G3-WIS-01]|uniref:hypothetical protein n=1 Tax=Coleofasciculus sp. G3-WIS-01 TaxID=3069528 RepID=UPI0032FDE45A
MHYASEFSFPYPTFISATVTIDIWQKFSPKTLIFITLTFFTQMHKEETRREIAKQLLDVLDE